MIRSRSRLMLLACASVVAFLIGAAPDLIARAPVIAFGGQPTRQDPPPPQQDPEPGRGGGPGRGGQQAGPRPYNQVITNAAKTDDGVFKVHRINDTIFYEIPKAELGKDFLWITQLKRTTLGAGFGGQTINNRVVRWVAKGDRILLLNMDYSIIADPSNPVSMAVADANYPAIIRAINVAAYAPSGDPVIDVTQLFTTDVPEFSARGAVGGRGVAADRTFLERATSFPENINVEVTMTFTGADAGGGGGGAPGAGRAGGMRGSSGTVVVHHSMLRLPEKPMTPRYYDERVGFFTQQLVDFGTDEHRSVQKRFITRFRLDKKDASAAVSEPVKPIIFYVDPATPAKWVPFVKKGVESWQPAFEDAGFRNAIVAKDAPANDPEWDPGDARYSVVRWLPSAESDDTPPIHDPRSGEVLEADIEVFDNLQNFGSRHYFVQVGPLDKRVQTLPIPDEVMGELIRAYVAQKVGHSLGLERNRKAGATYTIAQVRDPKWVKANGFTASLMDDARFNYVAQPEDNLDPADLVPKLGPYDRFATMWGYKPIPSAKTADQEKATLDQWAREQDQKPYLRFSTEGQRQADDTNSDPGSNAEAVGDIDAVQATTLGLKNLDKVSSMLLKATSTKTGDPWDEMEAVYGRMANQWSLEMSHVVSVIGGIESQQKHIGQGGDRFKTVAKPRQVEALQFLLANGFTTPAFMIRPEILRRIQPTGAVDRVRAAQASILASLLQNARLNRMTEQAAIDGAAAYSPLQFLADLRAGVWSEVAKPGASIDIYRRNLQRAYLENMDQRLNGQGVNAEIRAIVKGELRALDGHLLAASKAPALDENTRRHLTDSHDEITAILDPRVPHPAPAAPGAAGPGRGRGGFQSFAPAGFQQPQQQDPPDPTAGRGGSGRGGQAPAPRPYAQVITSAAKTDDGVFKVHRISDTLFYEIPKKELDKDFLWNTQLKKTAIGVGYGGQAIGSRVVRWSLKGDRVLLLNIEYGMIADASNALSAAANAPAIIRTFNVAAYSPGGDPVIDVTSLFTGDVAEFSARGRVGGRGMDASRTFLERAISFPENINVEVTATYTAADAGAAPAGGGRGGGRGGGPGPSLTVLVHHSMVKLPEKPMMPRLFDERVGYFTQGLTDYGTGEQQPAPTRYITRYRLEKKDPNAALSEPIKPIVYYVDPATPKQFVPWIKKGIESWQPAFEAAGFKNGIIAKEAPPGDTEWSAEDVRYSVVRWLPSTTENAVGPHVHDPRSGEILEADVQFYHNVQNLGKNWYFVQSGPLDPRAQQLPLPDDLMGALMQYVVAHEVGHTLGFQHNMKASSTYTIDQVRDPKWVKENGHTPTLMDYSRFNYVAQPEDRIDTADLIPKIGPYDKWATMWGYKPIPGARTPEEEKATLDKWSREQDAKPYLRFSTEGQGGTDPGDNTEAVGDGDAVKATTLGMKNLGRVSEMLIKSTSSKTGDPWDELEEVYGRMIGQWQNEMGHVVRIIGGVDSQQKHIGQDGVRFVTVAKARQMEALQFLLNNAFTTPSFMVRPEILRKIQPSGVVDRVRTMQSGIMGQLLQSARLDRMAEQYAIDGPSVAYSPLQFLGDLRTGVWSELAKPGTVINIYRRNLQRAYLDNMDQRLNGAGASAEVRSLAKGELRALDRQVQTALTGATDELTRRHLQDARDEIKAILDPLTWRPAPAGGALPFGGRGGGAGGRR